MSGMTKRRMSSEVVAGFSRTVTGPPKGGHYRSLFAVVVRAYRSAVSGRPKGLHYFFSPMMCVFTVVSVVSFVVAPQAARAPQAQSQQ